MFKTFTDCFARALLLMQRATSIYYSKLNFNYTLREKCPNTEFFLVLIFLYSDQKKIRIWTLFT